MWHVCQSVGDLAALTTGATPTKSCTYSVWVPFSSYMLVLYLTCSGLPTTPVPQTELSPSCQTSLPTASWDK